MRERGSGASAIVARTARDCDVGGSGTNGSALDEPSITPFAPIREGEREGSRCAGALVRRFALRRCRAAAAWPCSPSISPSATASETMTCAASVLTSSIRSHVRQRKKVKTESPLEQRAVPPVGSVWFGPAP